MAEEQVKITQESKNFRSVYKALHAQIAPLLTGRPEGEPEVRKTPDEINNAFQAFESASVGLLNSLSQNHKAETEVASAISGRDMKALAGKLKELFPEEFSSGLKKDYYTVLESLYSQFVRRYGSSLPENAPKTFVELLINSTRERTREILEGENGAVDMNIDSLEPIKEDEGKAEMKEVKGEAENAKVKEVKPPTFSSSEESDEDFIKWKIGWFEDLPGEDDFAKWAYVSTSDHIGDKIHNFRQLRDVALQRIRVMYMTNEVDPESERRIKFDDLIVKAEVLAGSNKEKQKYVDYFRYMVNGMRELNMYWLNEWIGTTNNGVGVNLVSIATGAAKIPDAPQAYISFLMKEKSVMDYYHTEIFKGGFEQAHKDLSGGNERSALAKILGYRLRRMTGQAIYDGIRKLTSDDFTKIAKIVDGRQVPDIDHDLTGLNEDQVAKKIQDGNKKLMEFNSGFENQLANAIFGVGSEIRPHAVDYQLFLNHFIPWYLNVRYKEKFKTMADTMHRTSRHIHEEFKEYGYEGQAIPGLLMHEEYERLGKTLESEFDHFNLGEIGAYSLWKRPDNSGYWLSNMQLMTFVGRVHFGQTTFDELENDFNQRMKNLKPEGEDREENSRLDKGLKNVKEARIVYEELLKTKTIDLDKFFTNGANFGMKMVSLYDPEHDTRSKQDEVNRNWSWKFGVSDWTWKNLKALTTAKKFEILGNFLDERKTALAKQHEIVRNNLIRTVLISQELQAELKTASPQVQGYFDNPLYEEFVDIDELYVKGKEVEVVIDGKKEKKTEHGESWMRFFDTSKFSHNAFLIYEGYASKTREIIHQLFDVTTPIPKHLELKEILRSSKAFKQDVDTALAVVSPETGYKEYRHAVAWRVERATDAIEDYVSRLYMLSIAAVRKTGVRVELAEQINQMVSQGVKEAFFKRHQFEPAMSQRQKAEGLEFTYNEITNHYKMGNDYKLRMIMNQAGFAEDALKDCGVTGDVQRKVWQEGLLANFNGDKVETDPEFIRYDTLLLMAGLKERTGSFAPGEVRGYEFDHEVANQWYQFYLQHRGGELAPGFDALFANDRLLPEGQKFLPLLLERARKIPTYADKAKFSDEQVLQIVTRQFEIMNDKFNDRTVGLFGNYMLYPNNVYLVWEKVIDSYVQKTFDVSRRYMSDAYIGKEKWPEREWDSKIDYMRREAFKSFLLRKRKYAIKDDNEGFNRYIVTQVRPDQMSLHQPYDRANWYINEQTGEQKMLDFAGTDEIESWLVGSGELDMGQARRLTRLPNYWDADGYYTIFRTVFSPGLAIKTHLNFHGVKWEQGEIKSVQGKRVRLGPWTWVMNPEKWHTLLMALRDPGGEYIMGWEDINRICERDGTTQEQTNRFVDERNWRKVTDLEVGQDKQLHEEEAESFATLDSAQSFLVELPEKGPLPEVGGLFNLKGIVKKIQNAGGVGRSAAAVNAALFVPLIGWPISIVTGLGAWPFVGAFLLGAWAFTNVTVNQSDVDASKRSPVTKALFDYHLPWWKHQAMGPSKITIDFTHIPILNKIPLLKKIKIESNYHFIQLPFIGGTILGSIKNVREMGRNDEVMMRGKEAVWDDLVDIRPIIKDIKDCKAKLVRDKPNMAQGAH